MTFWLDVAGFYASVIVLAVLVASTNARRRAHDDRSPRK